MYLKVLFLKFSTCYYIITFKLILFQNNKNDKRILLSKNISLYNFFFSVIINLSFI